MVQRAKPLHVVGKPAQGSNLEQTGDCLRQILLAHDSMVGSAANAPMLYSFIPTVGLALESSPAPHLT
jgi:hypothetical protein